MGIMQVIKLLVFVSCIGFSIQQCNSQALRLKESYDSLKQNGRNNALALYTLINKVDSNNKPQYKDGAGNICYEESYDQILGDRMGYVFSSYLIMYKTTGDKAYLNQFISETFFVQQFRNDKQSNANHPGWWQIRDLCEDVTIGTRQMYWDGKIIKPMAEYCFRILYDSSFSAIANMPIPKCSVVFSNKHLGIDDCNTKWPPSTIVTYKDYANWLAERVSETLNWYLNNGYWDVDLTFKQLPTDVLALQINQVANYGSALFYIGAYYSGFCQNITPCLNTYTTANDYLFKAKKIAERYKGKANKVSNINGICTPQSVNVFELYDSITNAYVWHTNGWETFSDFDEGCTIFPRGHCAGKINPSQVAGTYWEDIGHGSEVIDFPLSVFEYQNQFWGTTVFDSTDMQRFANTLTRLLYYMNKDGKPDFYYSVHTGDNNCYVCDDDKGGGKEKPYEPNRIASLAWAPLQSYDASADSNNVYHVLMNYYNNTLNSNPDNISEGNHYLGLAFLTQLQWEKECVNLNLYNRSVNYDQDFWTKNNLLINSLINPLPASYADPVISNRTFTIESGVNSSIYAGKEIIISGEAEFKAGSEVRVYINQDLARGCPQ